MKNTAGLSIVAFFFITVILAASTISKQDDLARTEWLVGTWENKTTRGSLFESWKKLNDHDIAGKSFIMKGKDTIVFESIHLIQKAEGLYYIPTVKNQNAGLPVSFKSTLISETE